MNPFQSVNKIVSACRLAASRGGLPATRQLAEIVYLKAFRNIGPNYYHVARFWRREIPFRDKLRHANDKEFIRLVTSLNPPDYQKASQHKVLEKATLSLFGVPTPKFVGFFHQLRGGDTAGGPLRSGEDLVRVLAPHAGRRVCFKAVEGFGGVSFVALDVGDDGRKLTHPISGQAWTTNEWVEVLRKETDGWLLEEYMPQHPDMAAINASSVNTLRVWVIHEAGEFKSCYAVLRVGRAGSQVDNTTSGGFGCRVDMSNGRMHKGLDLHDPFRAIERHPDTGVELEGRVIPYWPEVVALGAKALSIFPQMRFAGLDIAISPNGPVIIELNVQPDRISAVRWDIPHKDFFERVLSPKA